ncbi:STAS domain-containing protein [Actinoplanes sp. NPDC024001]|uniref:STAS domain-containing protein n=1 Tax=Actinoplanes sp. NPDC024001 TaxID=3154598 RepID=UPI003411F229
MKIVRLDDGGVVRLQIRGELDLATADRITEQVDQVLAGPPPGQLVVDLAGLTFCDSTGIDALINAREAARARGAGFRVVRPRGIVRRVLHATGKFELLTGEKPAALRP